MKKLSFQKIKAAAMLYIICFAATITFTACPATTKTVKAAVDASYRLPATTNDLIQQIADGRDRGILSIDDARRFGEILNVMAKAEVIFVDSVRAVNNAYEATGKFDPKELKKLGTYFDANIVGPFLQVLENARVLSGATGEMILLGIAAVRLLLVRVGKGFGGSSNLRNMRTLTAMR